MAHDNPHEMQSAHQWLSSVAEEFDLDEQLIKRLAGPLLDLTRDVAHQRSRPAAPLTAFLVGLAVDGRDDAESVIGDVEKRVHSLVSRIEREDSE